MITGGAMNGWFGKTATTSTGKALTVAEANTINTFNAGAGAKGYAKAAAELAKSAELRQIAATAAETGSRILGTTGGNILTNIPGKLASVGGNTLSSTAVAGGGFSVAPIVPSTLQKAVAVGGGTGAGLSLIHI